MKLLFTNMERDGTLRTVPFLFGVNMAKLKDIRNWEEEYKKLKVNFDRLDKFNDVLYRYYYYSTKQPLNLQQAQEALQAVEKYMNELEPIK